MKKTLVSIIIPCYNSEKYIDQSIQSVFQQNWTKLELIVVDDGSKDKTAVVVQKWGKVFQDKGWRLKYIYQKNAGPAAAINSGLKEVSGEYLSILDADDKFLDDSILKRATYLDENPECAMVRSNGWIVKENQRWPFVWDDMEKKNEDVFSMLMSGKTNNWAGSYMLRTEHLFRFYPNREIYPSRFGQNLQLMLPVAHKRKCGFIDEPLMEYIQITNSLSRENNPLKKKEKAVKNAEGYYDIRRHMIEILHMTDTEKAYWSTVARGILYRRKIDIAIEHEDELLLKESIEKLKSEDLLDMNDRIVYWNYKFKPFAIVLRVIRRLLHGK